MSAPIAPDAIVLVPITSDASAAVSSRATVRISRFPFRIGRESRSPQSIQKRSDASTFAEQLNDLYLAERTSSQLRQISREHCEIDYVNGQYLLVDRGSMCGTAVQSGSGTATVTRRTGGDRRGGQLEVHDGDIIVIGTARSSYRFQVHLDSTTR